MAALLYLVPTPIGNLSDISDRCRQTLAEADFIAAEDTRVTRKLLNHLQLHKPLVSYHEHNKGAAGPEIIARIAQGQTCALVTDAGSPAISDPERTWSLGGPVADPCLCNPRPLCGDHRPEHLRAADRPLRL